MKFDNVCIKLYIKMGAKFIIYLYKATMGGVVPSVSNAELHVKLLGTRYMVPHKILLPSICHDNYLIPIPVPDPS